MELKSLQNFIDLATTESLTLSAHNLQLSSQELSVSLNELEKEIGLPLFIKKARKLQLTPYGEKFLCYASDGVAKISTGLTLINAMASTTEEIINIGVSPLINAKYLSQLLFGFMSIYPHIHINITQKAALPLIKMLQNHAVHWLLCCDSNPLIFGTDIHSVAMIQMPFVVLISKQNPLSQKAALDYYDLRDTKQIFTNHITRENYLKHKDFYNIPEPPTMVYAGDTASIYELVSNNAGVYFTTGFEHNIDESKIAIIPFSTANSNSETLLLAWTDGLKMTPAQILFKNYMMSKKDI